MKKILLIIQIVGLVFTTGCWDMKEINERIFPYSVGLDLVDPEDFKNGRYEVSFTYPNIHAVGSQAIQGDLTYLTSIRGNSIFEGVTNMTKKLQRPMYLRDLKVVVIPEVLAKDKTLIKEIIDGLNRDYIVNKIIHLVVVKSTAKELLEVKVKTKKQIAIEGTLYELLRNDQGSTSFIPGTLNNFVGDMYTCNATVLPVARIEGEEIIADSIAVFKDYKLVDYLDDEDSRNISILTNNVKDFGVNVEYEGTDIALRTPRPKTKRRLIQKKDTLKMKYAVKIEGQIEQFILDKDKDLSSEEKLLDIESKLEENIKKSMKKTIGKLQGDMNADLIGVADYLYKFHPNIWKEIKEEYDEIFPDIDIELDIDVKIRRRGLTK